MIKFFIDAFKITNNNIILATPLILFMLLTTIYNGVFNNVGSNSYVAFLGIITYIFMWAAFLSGWFFIVRQAVLFNYESISNEEKNKKSLSLLSYMLKGIGEKFFPFLAGLIIDIFFFILFVLLIHFLGMNLIGKLNIPINDFINVANSNSPEVIDKFISSMPGVEMIKLAKWIYLCLFSFPVFIFFQLFWPCSLIKDTNNVLKAFFYNLKFIFKNFISTLVFFMMITILQLGAMLLCGLLSINNILSYFSLFVYFYFMVYIVIVVFLFYEKYKAKSVCNSGADSFGEKCICDTTSEKN